MRMIGKIVEDVTSVESFSKGEKMTVSEMIKKLQKMEPEQEIRVVADIEGETSHPIADVCPRVEGHVLIWLED